jgi:hypothetical protein
MVLFLLVPVIGSITGMEGAKIKISGNVSAVSMVALRPEDIAVDLSPINDANVNVLKAVITEYSDLGSMVMIKADAGVVLNAAMSKNSFLEKGLETGKEVWLNFGDNVVKTIE